MSVFDEPPLKRNKTCEGNEIVTEVVDKYIKNIQISDKNLEAIVSDDLLNPIPLIKMSVGHVKNPKDISRIVLVMNDKLPLKEFQHLKRVWRRDVILCPINFLNSVSSIQEYIECHVPELKDMFDYFKECDVPYTALKTKKQFLEYSRIWSCNFHPDKYLERLLSDQFFIPSELKFHKKMMSVVFEITKFYLKNKAVNKENLFDGMNVAIVVDKSTPSIVAAAVNSVKIHPLQHATMLAIDNVAKTQGGGAWNNLNNDESKPMYLRGVSEELRLYLRDKCSDINIHARVYKEKSDNKNSAEKDGPYLCTGYDVYVLKEPCLMCSMALVHARAKRVFFCYNDVNGALKTRTKLQNVKSLNHHFEVFSGFF